MASLRVLRASLSLAVLAAAPAAAHNAPGAALGGLQRMAEGLGVAPDAAAPEIGRIAAVEGTSSPDEAPVPTVESLVNFEYGDVIERWERTRVTIVRGRGRNRRRVSVPANSGVTDSSRLRDGRVNEIVLHASLGAGACEGSVNYLLRVKQAAHFMVCRTGRVYQMVEVDDVARHVKNDETNARSVGIETESGHLTYTDARGRSARAVTDEQVFWTEDWDPAAYWPMYVSIAGIVRAVAREGRIPRDTAHIRTHKAVDAGERDGHTDPGGVFDGGRGHVYPDFDRRYPGQNLSPYGWLMKLVKDDTPPAIVSVLRGGAAVYRVRDTDDIGLAYVRVWRHAGAPGPDVPKTKVEEWAAKPGEFPDAVREVAAPAEPGDYTIIARDLVGNITGVQVRVEPASLSSAGLPATPLRRLDGVQLAAFEGGLTAL